MPTRHWLIAGALAALGLAALSRAAPPQAVMAVDLGLWELTAHPQVSGAAPIPDARLAQLSPEQRQLVEKAMAGAATPHTWKSCLTEEKRAHGFSTNDERASCKTTVIVNTSSEYQARRECSSEEGKAVESSHWKIDSRQHATGEVDTVLSSPDGRSMTRHSTVEAKWLGRDCGDVG
jgi:hypothetical protein